MPLNRSAIPWLFRDHWDESVVGDVTGHFLVQVDVPQGGTEEPCKFTKQGFTTEEITHKLLEADVLIGHGQTVRQATKQIAVTDNTYFRWRKSQGGPVSRISGPLSPS